MSKMNELGQLWKIAGELDVSDIQQEALNTPRLAMVGPADKTGILQSHLQQGPRSAKLTVTAIPVYHLPLSPADLEALAAYDLRIMLLDDPAQLSDQDIQALSVQPAPLLIVLDQPPGAADSVGMPDVRPTNVVVCLLNDAEAVDRLLLPALLKQLNGRELALGRAYPGLREHVCRELIQDTCTTNAIYAGGTGLASMVPGIGIPFAVADIVILTKNQIMMAYKIALIMGESGSLREVLPQMAGVVGAGFMWRQIARELAVLIPLGVVLKVAIAYAGTYTTGHAMFHWYATGEKLSRQDLKALFQEALHRGQLVAEGLIRRARRDKEPPSLLKGPGTS